MMRKDERGPLAQLGTRRKEVVVARRPSDADGLAKNSALDLAKNSALDLAKNSALD